MDGSKCPAGTIANSFTSACESCIPGMYNDKQGSTYCKMCPGNAHSPVGSASTNDCSGCRVGYQFTENDPACEICIAGRYMDETTSSVALCKKCTVGYFLSDASGTRADLHDNSNDCFKCQSGTISSPLGGSDFCFSCGPGEYQFTINATAEKYKCKNCPMGFYTELKGLMSCKACPLGFQIDSEKSPYCLPCGSGTYTDQTSQTKCKNCMLGKYRKHHAGSRYFLCVDCPKGFAIDARGAAACVSFHEAPIGYIHV